MKSFYRFLLVSGMVLGTYALSATNYYVSSSGNDVNDVTSESLPWLTLTKVESFSPKPEVRDVAVDGIEKEVILVAGNVSNSLSGSTNTIYIDPTYTGINGVENGTIERPYNSFSDFTLQSNYTYRLKRGTTYTSSSKILLYRLSNVTVRDYGSGEKPIFNYKGSGNIYAFQFNKCTDCSIINIHLTAPTAKGLAAILGMGSGGFTGGTRITVDGCKVEKAGSDASGAMGIRGGGNQIKILNTIITDISLDGIYMHDVPSIEIGYSDISDINRKYFSNTDSYYSSGDGIQLNGNYDDFHIHHTTIDRTNEAGNKFNLILNSATKGAGNYTGIIEYNTFINNHSKIPASVLMDKGTGIVVRYNTFNSSTTGIRFDTEGTLIHNNIFYNSTDGIRIVYGTPGITKVFNNVFYKVSQYHIVVDRNAVEARNNIHLRSGDSGVALHNNRRGSWTLSNNCYGDITTAGTPGTGTNAVIGNPLFVNPGAYNFHLQNSSPCINAGLDVGINQDFENNIIPQGSAPDIGANESIPFGATGNVSASKSDQVVINLPDKTKPVVTAFSVPETYSSLAVPVSSFIASDNKSVTGFKLTETSTAPNAADAGWNSVAPTSYNFSSQGNKTIYAWVKDATGNVSISENSSVTIELINLNVPSISDVDEYVTICEGEEYFGRTTSDLFEHEIPLQNNLKIEVPNLIRNPSFTDGLNYWLRYGIEEDKSSLNLDNNDYISSPASLRFDCISNENTIRRQQVKANGNMTVVAGKEYELTFYAKATAEFSIEKLVVVKGTSPYRNCGSFDANPPIISENWKQYKLKFTASKTESDAQFWINIGNNFPAGHSIYLDDVTFTEYQEEVIPTFQVITTYLTVNPTLYATEEISISNGDNYQNWTEPGQYQRILTSSLGCDSIVTTILNVLKNATIPENVNTESVLTQPVAFDNNVKNLYIENSINILDINDFRIYPNPSKSFVNVEYLHMPEIETRIIIIDGNGRTILNQIVESASNRIDVSQFSVGLYYIRSINQKWNNTKKLIIAK